MSESEEDFEAGAHRSVVRRGKRVGSASEPLVTPIWPSVAWRSGGPDALDALYDHPGSGYTYAREGHPNADVLADKLDWLEGGEGGLITASGMAALAGVVLGVVERGQHVIAGNQLYGRSARLLGRDLRRFGVSVTFADATDAEAIAAEIRPETRLIVIETVSNPLLGIADLEGIAALARRHGILLAVDNTFTTPRAIRPLEFGADVVFNSVTKLLAGHSDVTLGHVLVRDRLLRDQIRDAVVTWGLTPSPFDCWLAERGLHSFALRYDRATENATELADFLAELEGVEQVLYPGRPDHPQHGRARHLLGGNWGQMLSFRLAGGRAAVAAMVEAMPHVPFAPTLGDVATLISHPATSSHRGLLPAERAALGIDEGLVRVSVGIEDIELIKDEFERGIAAARAAARAGGDEGEAEPEAG